MYYVLYIELANAAESLATSLAFISASIDQLVVITNPESKREFISVSHPVVDLWAYTITAIPLGFRTLCIS